MLTNHNLLLTSPIKLIRVIDKHQFVGKKIMSRPCEGLSKNICHLKIGGDMKKRDDPSFVSLTDEVAINLNMFSTFMENGISRNVCCTSIICMKRSRTA